MIFKDMSKAFDKVSHTTLINKLRQYKIGGPLLQWFASYLHGRQQRVTILGATSSKSLSIARCNEPIIYPYKIKGKQLRSTPTEKDLGFWITSDLTWSKHVLNRCAWANKLLGYVKRCSEEISNVRARRTLYLSLVRSVFGYLSQVWSPQTVILMQRVERVQRRATKYILNLPYLCSETYQERLVRLHRLPLSY